MAKKKFLVVSESALYRMGNLVKDMDDAHHIARVLSKEDVGVKYLILKAEEYAVTEANGNTGVYFAPDYLIKEPEVTYNNQPIPTPRGWVTFNRVPAPHVGDWGTINAVPTPNVGGWEIREDTTDPEPPTQHYGQNTREAQLRYNMYARAQREALAEAGAIRANEQMHNDMRNYGAGAINVTLPEATTHGLTYTLATANEQIEFRAYPPNTVEVPF